MDSENKKITAFLEDARNRNNCKLRIANMIEGKLCAKILVYNSDLDAIKMWTVYPNQEYAQDPGKQFSTETYAIEEDAIKTDNMLVKLNQDDILFIKPDSKPHRLIIHTKHGIKNIPGSLKELATCLNPRFFRCHDSFLVNMEHVVAFDKEIRQLIMDNQERCPVSIRMIPKVKKQMLRRSSCKKREDD